MTAPVIAWLEREAALLWGDVLEIESEGVKALWSVAKPLLAALAPAVVAELKTTVASILADIEDGAGKDLATLEAAVLNRLELDAADLFAIAKDLGSNLLQALIALIRAG